MSIVAGFLFFNLLFGIYLTLTLKILYSNLCSCDVSNESHCFLSSINAADNSLSVDEAVKTARGKNVSK